MVKNLPVNKEDAGGVGSIPRLGRSPGGAHGNPLQHSCLENSMDRGTWRATVQMVAESDMTEQLSIHIKQHHQKKKEKETVISYLIHTSGVQVFLNVKLLSVIQKIS